ncbi:MAG: transglycosylase domain-containing protein [Azonexus sp.]|nr:transglycosylase domain-containing protein [Azonexus sp.]
MRRLSLALLALALTAVIAALLIARLLFAPGPDAWSARLELGPIGLDVDVPAALRLITSPRFAPWLAGRKITSRFGKIRLDWDENAGLLTLQCAPCSLSLPALGKMPIRVDRLQATVRREVDALSGSFAIAAPGGDGEGAPIVLTGQWAGRLTAQDLRLDIRADTAPITHWYAALAPDLPELRQARIGGTLGLSAEVTLPGGDYALTPQITAFTVVGLGVEALANTRSRCGPASGLSKNSWLARAVIAAEDQRFFDHPGYDLDELAAALQTNHKAARIARGGSTITQQLAKLLVTGGERNSQRKLRELLYAVEMEQTLGKARILTLYLDNAPWGERLCGAEMAARVYFKRPARQLTPTQAVWLAAMLTNPAVAARQWQADGHIDIARATRVAKGVRGINRKQRTALVRRVTATKFSPQGLVAGSR